MLHLSPVRLSPPVGTCPNRIPPLSPFSSCDCLPLPSPSLVVQVPAGVKPKVVYSQRRLAACLAMLRLLQSCAKRVYGGSAGVCRCCQCCSVASAFDLSAVTLAASSLPVVLCKLAQGHDHSGLVSRAAKLQGALLPHLAKKWRVKYPQAVNVVFCCSRYLHATPRLVTGRTHH